MDLGIIGADSQRDAGNCAGFLTGGYDSLGDEGLAGTITRVFYDSLEEGPIAKYTGKAVSYSGASAQLGGFTPAVGTTATITGLATSSALLTAAGNLTGASLGCATESAGLTGPGALAGATQGMSLPSGIMAGTAALAGATQGISSASAMMGGTGVLAAQESGSMSGSSAALGAPPVPTVLVWRRATPWQPTTRTEDYAGFRFWQRRLSGRQPRNRRLT
jgi:hypothetical protein